jgi:hypothetical protein
VTEQETGLFYGISKPALSSIHEMYQDPEEKLTGSNGFAVGPSLSKSGHAMLYINPHVTFYFRPEVHVASEQGLHAYGAVTWGQFFVYQGFNQFGGWMHTSSEVDVADAYAETTRENHGKMEYFFEGKWRPMLEKQISLGVKGEVNPISVKAYFTHRGPVLAKRDGRWISVRSFNRSMTSLIQSWARTKTKSFTDFKRVMDLRGNTSNNTVYAGQGGQNFQNCGSVKWLPWTIVGVNLTAYMGTNVTVEFTTKDCNYGGHFGYAYVVADCMPLVLDLDYCFGSPNINIAGPSGFQSYSWSNGANTQAISVPAATALPEAPRTCAVYVKREAAAGRPATASV